MAKLKSGTRIYGTATIDTSVVVGSGVTITANGINVVGVVTATTFVGALTGTASSTTNIPNLTGAITSNNTTTSLGSFTSAQLATALTDETGSGANVFATSPTLVTPALGAATATSIVVSSGSTFTNGPILVGAATSTGTAAQRLQVTGGAYVSGSVGIGTTNPQYILTVTDTGTPATVGLTNCLADFTTTANSYGQINLRNTSTGTNASSDIIVTADTGNDTTNFVDLGINNSGFSVGSWTINGPTDGYLYTSSTNLSIGVAAAGKYLSFFTGGTLISNEKLRINDIGVGIGTTNPQATLQVGTGITMYGSTGIVSAVSYRGDGSQLTGVSGGVTVTDDTATNATRYILFDDVTSGTITGVNVSSSKLRFNPSSGTLSATVFTSLSDQTQKTNVRPVTNAIELVNQMRGVYYDWIDNHNKGSVGVIAQEMEQILPQVVTKDPNGLKSVSYGNIVGVLIEAIKEQQIRIEELEKKINA